MFKATHLLHTEAWPKWGFRIHTSTVWSCVWGLGICWHSELKLIFALCLHAFFSKISPWCIQRQDNSPTRRAVIHTLMSTYVKNRLNVGGLCQKIHILEAVCMSTLCWTDQCIWNWCLPNFFILDEIIEHEWFSKTQSQWPSHKRYSCERENTLTLLSNTIFEELRLLVFKYQLTQSIMWTVRCIYIYNIIILKA